MKKIFVECKQNRWRRLVSENQALFRTLLCAVCAVLITLAGCRTNPDKTVQRSLIEAETAIHSARLVGADSTADSDVQQAETYYKQAMGDLREAKPAGSFNIATPDPNPAAEKALLAKTKAEQAMQKVKQQNEELKISHHQLLEKLASIQHAIKSIQQMQERVDGQPEVVFTPEMIYQNAYQQFNQRDYPSAKAGFQSFLALFPQHGLSDNALYWSGECFYAVRDYGRALDLFLDVPKKYPTGNKVPDALLKAGMCYRQLGYKDQAAAHFTLLIQDYPHHPATKLAEKQLSGVKR